jgi:transcription elongation factor Elf1
MENVKKLAYGKEIIGAYGESSGVSCPRCGARQYPEAERGSVIFCDECGAPFRTPVNSERAKILNLSKILSDEQREAGYSLQMEDNHLRLYYNDKIMRKWEKESGITAMEIVGIVNKLCHNFSNPCPYSMSYLFCQERTGCQNCEVYLASKDFANKAEEYCTEAGWRRPE